MCFFATLVERRLAPASLQGYLSPINNRHADAGFARPAAGALVQTLRAGYNRRLADDEAAFPPAWAPLPAPLCWRIARLAAATTDAVLAVRLTAVVWQFVLACRTAELLGIQLRDVSLPPAGGAFIQIRRFKGGERRTLPRRLVVHVPPAPPLVPVDLPFLLLRGLVTHLRRSRAPPTRLLFSDPTLDRAPTAGDLTARLHAALAALRVAPPPGVLYSSYTCRSGGATALGVCGVPRPGIARLLGHSGNNPAVADARYVDALAPASAKAYYLCERYARSVPPGVTALFSCHSPS